MGCSKCQHPHSFERLSDVNRFWSPFGTHRCKFYPLIRCQGAESCSNDSGVMDEVSNSVAS